MSNHPQCCKNPDTCDLSYREHLIGFNLSAEAVPSRRVTKTEGMPDELTVQTSRREKRWERDHAAYRRLHAEGLRPPHREGSAFRERHADSLYDVNHRKVKIDYNDVK